MEKFAINKIDGKFVMEIENKFCAFIDILGFKNKTKNFENAVKYYKDYIRCYDLFTSIDTTIFILVLNFYKIGELTREN